jgi:hypothetical protein
MEHKSYPFPFSYGLPSIHIHSQLNSIYTISSHFCKTHFNNIVLSLLRFFLVMFLQTMYALLVVS